jgi:S-phase kinase-associated protein 1
MSAEDELTLDDTTTQDKEITLVSKEGDTKKTIPYKSAQISGLIKNTIDADNDASSIPLPSVSGPILAKIVDYMIEKKGTEAPIIEKPLRNKDLSQVTNPYDAKFINDIDNESRQQLYDIILAANYMDIKGLLHLGCAKVASLIKGQPLEKIKEILAKGTDNQEKSAE